MFSLAGLVSAPDGGFLSDGLALFTGQELSLREAEVGQATRQPKAALRLAHWLVEHGRLTQPQTVTGPDGDVLRLTPSPDHRLVNVEKS
ncbi:hypothetical protein KK137_05775 [Croceibacterium sp. LX-88]|jgi:hypothetical protein|uniref:Uncharacterized protein n=1 Tax=Croceibacterium selenioxidans TaxID=2838833 RepID=A0ABS5W262_9SPHN|nr:hypothetical protein [Croceibacterium selenioxidans]MBT2133838.1 hypothetical protein [Croceibacterium selenioxidans]